MPDVHALLRELGEQLADDGQHQWRRREVAERAGMPRIQLMGRDPVPELGQQVSRRRRLDRCRPGASRCAKEPGTQRDGRGRLAHRPPERLVVEVVERRGPGVVAEPLQRGTGHGRVPDVDQLRLRVPVERRRSGHPDGPLGHGRDAGPLHDPIHDEWQEVRRERLLQACRTPPRAPVLAAWNRWFASGRVTIVTSVLPAASSAASHRRGLQGGDDLDVLATEHAQHRRRDASPVGTRVGPQQRQEPGLVEGRQLGVHLASMNASRSPSCCRTAAS